MNKILETVFNIFGFIFIAIAYFGPAVLVISSFGYFSTNDIFVWSTIAVHVVIAISLLIYLVGTIITKNEMSIIQTATFLKSSINIFSVYQALMVSMLFFNQAFLVVACLILLSLVIDVIQKIVINYRMKIINLKMEKIKNDR